jgi:hypothetical protein
MRPRRVAVAASVSVLLCLMAWTLASQAGHGNGNLRVDYLRSLYAVLAGIQATLLLFWSFSACSQAIASERMLKTYDFLRTTRLTASELLTGMVFGIPVMAYFVTTLTYGITAIAGIMGGLRLEGIFATYFFMVLTAIVFCLAGLTISMMVVKPRAGIGLVFALTWLFSIIGAGARHGFFPAVQALLVVPALLPLFHLPGVDVTPTVYFFGGSVSQWVVTLVVYVSVGAWLVVMLRRNLKREREDIKLLSRWQAIGFAVYVNLLAFGMMDPRQLMEGPYFRTEPAEMAAKMAIGSFVFLNFLIFYAVGITTLSTPERLKVWWREERMNLKTYFAEDGPPWPWIVIAFAAALVLFGVESAVTSGVIVTQWKWPVWQLLVLLTFAMRDVMFLQWCTLTKMKDPVIKGVGFILLYYAAVLTFLSIMGSGNITKWGEGAALLTPGGALSGEHQGYAMIGAAIQLGLTILFAILIQQRFAKKASA